MCCVFPSFGFLFRASENFSIQSSVFHGGDPPSFSFRQCSAYRVWEVLSEQEVCIVDGYPFNVSCCGHFFVHVVEKNK